MNRLPSSNEYAARRPGWTEGTWITLADGQPWSFPSPETIPGYHEQAREAAHEVVDNLLPLLNADAVRRHAQQANAGDAAGLLRNIAQVFAIYQVAFRAGSILLKRNYDLTDADCDRLMPFNYQLTDLADPLSRVHQTTPEVLAISNAVSGATGVDIGPELERITGSN